MTQSAPTPRMHFHFADFSTALKAMGTLWARQDTDMVSRISFEVTSAGETDLAVSEIYLHREDEVLTFLNENFAENFEIYYSQSVSLGG